MEKSTQMLWALLGRLEVPIFAPIPNLWKDRKLRLRRQDSEFFTNQKESSLERAKSSYILI